MAAFDDARLLDAKQECEEYINTGPKPNVEDAVVYCEATWDEIACWNYTKAGETAVRPCPDYIVANINVSAVATRVCADDGKWMWYPEKNRTWSNYAQCLQLLSPDPGDQHETILQIFYTIGYGISLVALIVAIAIFLHFRKLRCPRNTIHMHFFVSFILRAVFIFIRDIMQARALVKSQNEQDQSHKDVNEVPYETPFCKMVFTAMQYFLVANYYWLLVEGVYLHSLITLAIFSGKTGLRYYIALGWGCPALIVLPWAIRNFIKEEPGCWWENVTTSPTYWIIKAPVMLSICVNFILFLNITRVLVTKLRASNTAEARIYSKLAKSTLVLIPIFGVYYIVTVGMHASNDRTVTLIRMYVDLIISPFQGLIMATLYCFLNGDVQAEIKRKWKLHKINRTLSMTRSVAPRSGAHSRSSVSTPPRKQSVGNGDDSGKDNSSSSRGLSLRSRMLSLKSRLFHTKPRIQHMNGSVGNYKDSSKQNSSENENGTKMVYNSSALEDAENPTETTKLKNSSPEDESLRPDLLAVKPGIASDEDELLKDNDSGHVPSGDSSRSPSIHDEPEPKKGVHFAANIETEV